MTEAESTRCRRKATALFILLSVKETFTGVLLPLLDMGTDIATAATHFVASAVSSNFNVEFYFSTMYTGWLKWSWNTVC